MVDSGPTFEPTVRDGVLRVSTPGARWLRTGTRGGFSRADAAYNLTVPEGFERTDLAAYVDERLDRAGFPTVGPALLTGVSMDHARGARSGDVVVYATAGLSNPAALPMAPSAGAGPADADPTATVDRPARRHDGTVNLLVGTTRALEDGALAELLGTVVEAKAATLLDAAGVPGTTSDAVAVACDPAGESAPFCGSGTDVGADARACVREAVRAALDARYPDGDLPEGPADAEYGTTTDRRAEVFGIDDASEIGGTSTDETTGTDASNADAASTDATDP